MNNNAATTVAEILGDAVKQMQAAHDKPRDDPLSIMEAALREIIASDRPDNEYKSYEGVPWDCGNSDDVGWACAAVATHEAANVAREALAKVEAFYAQEEVPRATT